VKHKHPVLLGRAAKVLDPFNLKMPELPEEVPYLVHSALHLPDKLTSKQIRQIGAAARIFDRSGFSLGDLLVWLKDHPEAPETHEGVLNMLLEICLSRRTIYNYQSISNTFPPEERVDGLSRPHHDAVRGLPKKEQRQLLYQALDRDWTDEELLMQVRIRKQELALRGNGNNLRGQALLALRRGQLHNTNIVRLLSKRRSLTTKEAASLERENVALFKEMGDVENLLKQF
jgi:hypothetical protein